MALEATREKIKTLEQKLKQAKALAQKQEAIAKQRELLKAGEESRREDTRKKILIGAYVMAVTHDLLMLGQDTDLSFVEWLSKARDDEKSLFGLQPNNT